MPARTTIVLDQPRTTAAASDDDPVPVNEIIEIRGAWDIAVTDVDTDAAEQLLAYANVNPQPAPDERFVLVTFHGQNLGDGIAQPVFEWSITDGENEYGPEVPGCGLIPDSIYDVDEVQTGETIVASVCAPVPESIVANGLFLTLQPLDDVKYVFSLGS